MPGGEHNIDKKWSKQGLDPALSTVHQSCVEASVTRYDKIARSKALGASEKNDCN